MLFDHWTLHRHSLARIGTFGRMSDLFPISSILQGTLGTWAAHGQEEAADAVTKHRIAIEIPYSFIEDTTERDTPIELQGKRDITIAESLRAGTRTHDALPLARRKPGEQTDVLCVGGLKSLSAVGGSQSAEPV